MPWGSAGPVMPVPEPEQEPEQEREPAQEPERGEEAEVPSSGWR